MIDRPRCDDVSPEHGVIARLRPRRHFIQGNHTGALKVSERIWLRVPVQIAERTRVAIRVMFSAFVIAEDDLCLSSDNRVRA